MPYACVSARTYSKSSIYSILHPHASAKFFFSLAFGSSILQQVSLWRTAASRRRRVHPFAASSSFPLQLFFQNGSPSIIVDASAFWSIAQLLNTFLNGQITPPTGHIHSHRRQAPLGKRVLGLAHEFRCIAFQIGVGPGSFGPSSRSESGVCRNCAPSSWAKEGPTMAHRATLQW